MSFLFHPAFQSVVLPMLLAIAGVALLRSVARPWAAMGAVAGLLLALAVLPGFVWPPATATQRLPWIVLGAAVLAAGVQAASRTPDDAAHTTGLHGGAALAVAALGLTAMAALGGSLLLAQLALMVAIATAVPGLWAWWFARSGVRVTLTALTPFLVAALVIAWALPAAGAAGSARLGLLLLALTAPLIVSRLGWARRHPGLAPLAVLALAALPVLLAVAWLWLAGGAEPPADADNPYYQPRWN